MPSYVVTGANRGIGLEFIRQLSANPTNVVFGLVRNKANSQDLIALEKELTNVHVLEADVTDSARLKAAATEVAKVTGGTLDYLINNAAHVQTDRRFYNLTTYAEKGEEEKLTEDFDANFRVNVLGIVYATNAFLPLLKATAASALARVITISSAVGDPELARAMGFGSFVPYCASKAAVNMVVAKYAAQFAAENIVFLALAPGLVDTATRAPTPEELANAMAFIEKLKKVYPNWEGKPLTPEQSVTSMLKIIEKLDHKDSGAYISHKGGKEWC
ncbi:SDR family oxidoreductase [Phanerochaete sordida]|uniref:SDR family oxidoreductase n=1 Tax=Phanerochaete sordida TaxID=48140 RepID=A0A9P3LC80_9APHY|nr:SDR family oxidoreductase [Phanerochaete sordida]